MEIEKNPKIRILILGYSYIVRKSIIKAIESNPYFTLVGIASKNKYREIPSKYKSYNSYGGAIKKSNCDVVYISLRNISHYEWIINSLKEGKHVICDKPAALNKKQALDCYKKAGNNLILFESIAYPHHKQHQILKKEIKKQLYPLQKITANFGFPPLDKGNFRNFAEFGGGCLYDIGPYIISVGQIYFNKRAEKIYCDAYTPKGSSIPTSASVMIHYGENKVLQGHFGFQLEYRNNLNLWGYQFNYSLDRAFTIPPDFSNAIIYKTKDKIKDILIPPCDHFSEMLTCFSRLLQGKSGKSLKNLNKLFLEQAIQLESMIKSAKTKKVQIIDYG